MTCLPSMSVMISITSSSFPKSYCSDTSVLLGLGYSFNDQSEEIAVRPTSLLFPTTKVVSNVQPEAPVTVIVYEPGVKLLMSSVVSPPGDHE